MPIDGRLLWTTHAVEKDEFSGQGRWTTMTSLVGDQERRPHAAEGGEFSGQCRWFRYDDHARWNLNWRCGVST